MCADRPLKDMRGKKEETHEISQTKGHKMSWSRLLPIPLMEYKALHTAAARYEHTPLHEKK